MKNRREHKKRRAKFEILGVRILVLCIALIAPRTYVSFRENGRQLKIESVRTPFGVHFSPSSFPPYPQLFEGCIRALPQCGLSSPKARNGIYYGKGGNIAAREGNLHVEPCHIIVCTARKSVSLPAAAIVTGLHAFLLPGKRSNVRPHCLNFGHQNLQRGRWSRS